MTARPIFTTPEIPFTTLIPHTMPSLDIRGKIAAAEIGFYAPIAVLTALLVFRYAFRRDAGWFFLCIFSMGNYTQTLNLGYCSNSSTFS